MYRLDCHIEIGSFQFFYVHELEIRSSWKDLTDTCVIRLPRNLKLKGESLKDLIKKGDKVTVKLGYNAELRQEFSGYVTGIKPTVPLEIECEDAMWQLKQTKIKKSWEAVKLADLLAAILPAGISYNAADIELGPIRINNLSAAKVLKELKDKYGIISYFRNGVLQSGLAYPLTSLTESYHFQKNIRDNSLEYVSADDVEIRVRAISIMPDNSKVEVELGSEDGEERTLHFYNLKKADLQAAAEREISRLKYSGYRGSFKAFGRPYIEHGYIATLTDDIYPERSGSYLVDRVQTRFGQAGFSREIELGPTA